MGLGQFLAFGRHLQVGIGVTDCFDQKAILGIARNDRRPGIAALFPATFPIELHTAFDFTLGGTVALVTVVGEDRPDFIFEKLELGLGRLGGRASAAGAEKERGEPRESE